MPKKTEQPDTTLGGAMHTLEIHRSAIVELLMLDMKVQIMARHEKATKDDVVKLVTGAIAAYRETTKPLQS